MTDPYHNIGAQQDRARTWTLLARIADALERIADALADDEEDDDEYRFGPG